MNLIKQLGGYENAKNELKVFGILRTEFMQGVFKEDLQNALLEYRRANNIYEAGDLVVMVDEDDYGAIFKVIGKPQRLYHLQGNDDLFYGRLDFQIRHATDEEIKSGDRIKQGVKS